MTITGTSTHHQLMVAWALHDIETLTGPNPSREKAERVLREWHSYDAMTGVEIEDVLSSYYPEEPPMVAGRDWLPADLREVATADAALIVAKVLTETKLREYRDSTGDRDLWREVSPGYLAIVQPDGSCDSSGGGVRRSFVEDAYGPLVEVTDEPTAGA